MSSIAPYSQNNQFSNQNLQELFHQIPQEKQADFLLNIIQESHNFNQNGIYQANQNLELSNKKIQLAEKEIQALTETQKAMNETQKVMNDNLLRIDASNQTIKKIAALASGVGGAAGIIAGGILMTTPVAPLGFLLAVGSMTAGTAGIGVLTEKGDFNEAIELAKLMKKNPDMPIEKAQQEIYAKHREFNEQRELARKKERDYGNPHCDVNIGEGTFL